MTRAGVASSPRPASRSTAANERRVCCVAVCVAVCVRATIFVRGCSDDGCWAARSGALRRRAGDAVRVPAERQAALREQLALQERVDDSQRRCALRAGTVRCPRFLARVAPVATARRTLSPHARSLCGVLNDVTLCSRRLSLLAFVNTTVLQELRRIIEESEIIKCVTKCFAPASCVLCFALRTTRSLSGMFSPPIYVIFNRVFFFAALLFFCSRARRPFFNREDDSNWPAPDRVGKQELEIVLGDEHISFSVR